MGWSVLLGLVLAPVLVGLGTLRRRLERARGAAALARREELAREGVAQATLHHPAIDLSKCLGCATCVAVCPEGGVLEIVHGQAMVVNGARCMGVAACERECPAGAIQVRIASLEDRRDVPAITEELEAAGVPGLFLAGEVTAQARIKTAIEHGKRVAAEVARRRAAAGPGEAFELDLLVVGAGPAGLACALEARRRGLRCLVVDQEPRLGGTVAHYPRRKVVLTEPVTLPLAGRLRRTRYTKEELVELWEDLAARHELAVRCGERLVSVQPRAAGEGFEAHTTTTVHRAFAVCLAIGRRGEPRRLGVPGEELAKVAYSLVDAAAHAGRRVLVVGGGDSAVEAALALASQPGAEVTLSYRKQTFYRLRERNARRLEEAERAGVLRVLRGTHPVAIAPDHVVLETLGDRSSRLEVPNDDVFVMIGGAPPAELLARCGVSLDPAERPPPRDSHEPAPRRGSDLRRALTWTAVALAVVAAWVGAHASYYFAPAHVRPTLDAHAWLRPGRGAGLVLGVVAGAMILANLCYLARRAPTSPIRFGTLRAWMTAHVATGLAALMCALVHGALAPRDTPGGHALWGLVVLAASGAIGRYLYAWVPRAANGRELELDEVRARLGELVRGAGPLAVRARERVEEIVRRRRWGGSLLGRLWGLVGERGELRRLREELTAAAGARELDPLAAARANRLVREALSLSLAAARYEDLRALLSSWRWVHRWVALAMVTLVVVHVAHALVYGEPGLAAEGLR